MISGELTYLSPGEDWENYWRVLLDLQMQAHWKPPWAAEDSIFRHNPECLGFPVCRATPV
jgi:hypothetical protein